MMTEVINLRQQRKIKARAQKAKEAAENRRKHGRTKAEKQTEKLKTERLDRHLEGHKLEPDEE
jgi:hypothetical protein